MGTEEEIKDPFCDEDNPISVDFDDITSAAYRIKSGVRFTECIRSEHLSNLTGMEIYLKKECLQITGSFKERGARNTLLSLPQEIKDKGIVAASAGNHALACCYHGLALGIPITVVMPETAPIMKVQKCRNYKGNVILYGKVLVEAKRYALKYAKDHGMMYINGYDHKDILAGQGTIGLEIWEQIPGLDAVIVPVGGGGLIAGINVAIKALNKKIKVYGAEPERAPCLFKALEAGKPTEVTVRTTLADGLAVAKIGVNSFASVKNIIDRVVLVEEEFIALSIVRLIEYEKTVVEGAGATALASILSGQMGELKGKKVCLILSGGNIDTTVLGRVIDRGLAADGRLVKVKITVSDRPGGIEDLCNHIGSLGVSIKDIMHERAWVTSDVFSVSVKVICETRDYDHSLNLRDALVCQYGKIVFNGVQFPDESAGDAKVIPKIEPKTEPVFESHPADAVSAPFPSNRNAAPANYTAAVDAKPSLDNSECAPDCEFLGQAPAVVSTAVQVDKIVQASYRPPAPKVTSQATSATVSCGCGSHRVTLCTPINSSRHSRSSNLAPVIEPTIVKTSALTNQSISVEMPSQPTLRAVAPGNISAPAPEPVRFVSCQCRKVGD